MSKIRINDLARELEVKSRAILDVLPVVGVTEKKTHSSSIEDHEAEKVRAYLKGGSDAQSGASKASRSSRADADEIKTKIDLSHISKPGDVLNAIRAKQQAPVTTTPPPPHPPVRPAPVAPPAETKPAASAAAAPLATAPQAPAPPAPRLIVPTATPRPTFTVTPPPPPRPVPPPPATAAP